MTLEGKLIVSYTIYMFLTLLWMVFIWTATGYVVFILNNSGWWFLLTTALSCPIMPWKWHAIVTGRYPPKDEHDY